MGNMFRCTLASGGGFVLTVTCASQFARTIITCTDGTTTLTDTCPSTSPYTIEFSIPNGGIWTVSGVYGGSTISESVTIEDSVTLNATPEGSTVLPTDDIQIWLHCANIWDKSYTTISQVLADASTLQALIASTNAVDYMARSTTWASSVTSNQSAMGYIGLNDYCSDALLADLTWLTAICNSTYFESVLNVKVPTMTSNTTPSGVASASSVHSDSTNGAYSAYKAFNKASGQANCWHSAANGMPNAWLRYDFNSSIQVNKFSLQNVNFGSNLSAKTFKIQGSNDGDVWTDIDSTFTSKSTASGVQSDYVLSNNNKYSKYRILILTSVSGTYVAIDELQFYGRA